MFVQYVIIGSRIEHEFSEAHTQSFRPIKGDIYFAKLKSGEVVKTKVTDIVINPGTLPECKDTLVEIIAYIE